ncbi:MAG: hypothetical protein K5928_09450 [Prevotella sp.]|nr:hypothetical protein [Prevotella sp.]
MIDFEEELRKGKEEDEREAQYIKEQLPAELKEEFSRTDIMFLMDLIVDHYYESGLLADNPELPDDAEVEVDLEQVAEAVWKKAEEQGYHRWTPESIFFVVQADFDFMEQNS